MTRPTTHNGARWQRGQCRCPVCWQAYRADQKRYAATRRARLAADPTLRPHGDTNTYANWGCRCDPCCLAWHHKMQERKRGQSSQPGRRRRNGSGFRSQTAPIGRDRIE